MESEDPIWLHNLARHVKWLLRYGLPATSIQPGRNDCPGMGRSARMYAAQLRPWLGVRGIDATVGRGTECHEENKPAVVGSGDDPLPDEWTRECPELLEIWPVDGKDVPAQRQPVGTNAPQATDPADLITRMWWVRIPPPDPHPR